MLFRPRALHDPLQPLALPESRPSTNEPKRHRAESAPFIWRIERDSLRHH